MPKLVQYIDAIARQKQRGVLYVRFHSKGDRSFNYLGHDSSYKWETDKQRKSFCKWLDKNNISWQCCGDIANENYMMSYQGHIYLDVPFDENNPLYVLLRDYLETPDGNMRFETMTFCYLSLEQAMKNAHHDEPDFWEKWAETF